MIYFKEVKIGQSFVGKDKALYQKTSARYARRGSMPCYRLNALALAFVVPTIRCPLMTEQD